MLYTGTIWEEYEDPEDFPEHEPEYPENRRNNADDEKYIQSVISGFGKQVKNKPSSTPRDRNGYVYLLCVPNTPGLYKIGRASNPENRLHIFNVKIPFPVAYEHLIKTDDCYALETTLHRLFASQRLEGEFFQLTAADVAFIKSLAGS